MNFSFELPRNNKELLEDANGSNYFVRQVYTAAEIPKHLRGNYTYTIDILIRDIEIKILITIQFCRCTSSPQNKWRILPLRSFRHIFLGNWKCESASNQHFGACHWHIVPYYWESWPNAWRLFEARNIGSSKWLSQSNENGYVLIGDNSAHYRRIYKKEFQGTYWSEK